MDIQRELFCTMSERDKRITKFALVGANAVAQDIGLFNFVLGHGETMERGVEYELTIRRKGKSSRNGQ